MKILMPCYEFPPVGGGGSKVVYGLSRELVRQGHEVDVVTMGFERLRRYEQIDGVNVYRVPCLRTQKSVCYTPEMASYLIAVIPALFKLARRNQYQINHTHFIFPDGLASLILKRAYRLPYVITAHGSDVPGYNPDRFTLHHRLLGSIWHKVVTNAECLVCPSQSLESLVLSQKPGVEIKRISNGIDPDKFLPGRPRKKSILVVSRMFERKGVQYFLQALEGLGLEFEIHIVGDGPYLPTLREMATRLPVRVTFHGWLDNASPELKQLYETSSIFVFPSQGENFPIVLLEAMTAGLGIITTRGTGCNEVVGEAALVVKPSDAEELRKAILRLTSDPILCSRLGAAARQRLVSRFSWTSVANEYARLYTEYGNDSRRPGPCSEVAAANRVGFDS